MIADFALFVMARRHIVPTFMDWQGDEWQTFTLQQFFRDDEPVEYTLADAKEVYHRRSSPSTLDGQKGDDLRP